MNKLKTIFKSAGTALRAVLLALALVAVFASIKASFFLLNLASTVGNLAGFLLLVFTVAFVTTTLITITKHYNEKL